MTIKQISVQLQNIPGQLAKLVDILDKEDISAKAISAASTAESSVVRLVVNDPDRAEKVLETFGFTFEVQPVLAVEVPCHPAGMNAIGGTICPDSSIMRTSTSWMGFNPPDSGSITWHMS